MTLGTTLSEKLTGRETFPVEEESVSEVMKAGMVSFHEIDATKIHSSAYETFHLPIEAKLTLYQAMKKLSNLQ